jgi:peptidoglycan/LPS O-acetylase OafA/YrhL
MCALAHEERSDAGYVIGEALYATTPAVGTQHVRFIDGLRAVAILMVVGAHALYAGLLASPILLPGLAFVSPSFFIATGAVGVQIFFFISGFALFYPYAQHLFEKRQLQTLTHYVERRVAKIVPSYLISLSLITILIPMVDESVTPNDTLFIHFIRHLFFLHGFWHETFGSISVPFWSIAIEVQFYVIFPLLAACFMRIPWLTLSALLLISISYHVAIVLLGNVENFVWLNQLPGYLSLFGFGSIAAYLIVRDRSRPVDSPKTQLFWTATTCAAAMILYGILGTGIHSSDARQWLNGTRECIGLTLLILSYGLSRGAVSLRLLCENPLLLWISDISYNLYLWNLNILLWYQSHVSSLLTGIPYGATLNTTLSLGLVTGVAWVVTKWIEKPLLRKPAGFLEKMTKRQDKWIQRTEHSP